MVRFEIALDQQSEEIAALQGSLNGLSEDVNELGETAVALIVQVSALEAQVGTLTAELDALREAAQRFDTFLSGLRELLDQAGSGLPETGPFRSRTPAPTALPVMTVIPLATPTP
jgi:prefoldin subunit 5